MPYLKCVLARIYHALPLIGLFALAGCAQINWSVGEVAPIRKTGSPEPTATTTLEQPPHIEYSSFAPAIAINYRPMVHTGLRVDTPANAFVAREAIAPIPPVSHLAGPPAASRATVNRGHLEVTRQNLWDLFIERQRWELERNPRITTHLNWFVKNPDYIDRVMQRGTPYLYHIVNELEKNHLPVELALLPVIESAYRPFAYSHGRATGIWQFIPSTGKAFGLKQNWWYDGRRDIVASTAAAIEFFKQLESEFAGDWLHALAAYNAGPAKIRKAIRRNRKKNLPTSFWDLRLPKETRNYIPRFLALIEVMRHPQSYGIVLPPIDAQPYFVAIDTRTQIDLAWAAKNSNTSIKEFYWLNPGFNRWATAPDGPHRLLVPITSAANFQVALDALPESERVTWIRHKIKAGESLSTIAERYKTTVRQLKKVNRIKGSLIRAGHDLMISGPGSSESTYAFSASQRLETAQSRGSGSKRVHRVRSGDTLWDLAKSYNSSARKIANWNNMTTRTPLRIGQKLVIWQPDAHKSGELVSAMALTDNFQPAIQVIRYVVRPGDSLNRIATRFNIQVTDLLRWNAGLQNAKYIQPGQKIRLELDVRQQSG